jgi:hypothetical protein
VTHLNPLTVPPTPATQELSDRHDEPSTAFRFYQHQQLSPGVQDLVAYYQDHYMKDRDLIKFKDKLEEYPSENFHSVHDLVVLNFLRGSLSYYLEGEGEDYDEEAIIASGHVITMLSFLRIRDKKEKIKHLDYWYKFIDSVLESGNRPMIMELVRCTRRRFNFGNPLEISPNAMLAIESLHNDKPEEDDSSESSSVLFMGNWIRFKSFSLAEWRTIIDFFESRIEHLLSNPTQIGFVDRLRIRKCELLCAEDDCGNLEFSVTFQNAVIIAVDDIYDLQLGIENIELSIARYKDYTSSFVDYFVEETAR